MKTLSIYLLFGSIVSPAFGLPYAQADFDVIVNDSIHVNEISKSQVKQIMLANMLELDKNKIVFIALSPDMSESDTLDSEAMGMSAIQAKKYWLTKVFNGTIANTPPVADSLEEVIEKVASTPGGLAVIPKGQKTGKTKLLKLK